MAPRCHLYKAHGVLCSYWAQQCTYNPEPAGPTWFKNCTSFCTWPIRLICWGLQESCWFFCFRNKCWSILKALPLQNQYWILAITNTDEGALDQISLRKGRRRWMVNNTINISHWNFPENLSCVAGIVLKQSWIWVPAIYKIAIRNYVQRLSYVEEFCNRFVNKAYRTSLIFWRCSKIIFKRQGKIHYTTNSVMKPHISNNDRKPEEMLQGWGDILKDYIFAFYIDYFFLKDVQILLWCYFLLFLLLIPWY